ncbi:MAG: type II secretion system F family protein [Bdellovibrionales bacterium]|nr:type II secretion system F family protein [Bdellovibrionales bacterium]
MTYVAIILLFVWISWMVLSKQHAQERELGRFREHEAAETPTLSKQVDAWFESLGRRFSGKEDEATTVRDAEKEMTVKLRSAGLETISDHGKYAAVRLICYATWPMIVIFAWSKFSTYYATVSTIFSFAFVILLPYLWLSRKTHARTEEIQRELPLVIDLTNLATSAGYDLSSALERVIDALAPEFPKHPLIKELKKARVLANAGYTWAEALGRVSRKIADDTVTRVMLSMVQALEQGGDRTAQLSGIAQDAQRTYSAALDKRLAAIPVKALIITVVLFLTYFAILLAPAAVGVEGSVTSL